MDHYGAPDRRIQEHQTYFTRTISLRLMGCGPSGMVGPRPLAGPTLDFTLASSEGHVRIDKGIEGVEGSRGKAAAGADEERDC